MNLRLRRLAADYEQMRLSFLDGAPIKIKEVEGNPPEVYRLAYAVTGLAQRDEKIVKRSGFNVEIRLPRSYPRTPPQCRMLTPVFHPNIAPHAICIGDHWAAGESLVDLALRIAEMLTYQSYNLKSPLNGEAARWAEEHVDRLPVEATDFSRREAPPEAKAGACMNCGATEGLDRCGAGHTACGDCRAPCGCGAALCLACDTQPCVKCGKRTCRSCGPPCANCSARGCPEHRAACSICGAVACGECAIACEACSKPHCLNHASACSAPAEKRLMSCPTCAKKYRVPEGREGRCPACKAALV